MPTTTSTRRATSSSSSSNASKSSSIASSSVYPAPPPYCILAAVLSRGEPLSRRRRWDRARGATVRFWETSCLDWRFWARLRAAATARSGRPQRWRTNVAPQANLRRASARARVGRAQQNRASVERHTSAIVARSGRRGRVASCLGITTEWLSIYLPPTWTGEGVSNRPSPAARPIPGNQTHTYSPAPYR